MSRFKFRVWNKVRKRMYDVSVIDYLHEHVKVLDEHGCELQKPFVFLDIVVLPCTGLKDKKGNLIYEGDLLKKDKDGRIYEVGWGFYQWSPYHLDSFSSRVDFDKPPVAMNFLPLAQGIMAEEWKIVGNIYENPDKR